MSDPHNMQTPTPRDHDDTKMSEIMPFRSSRIKLWKSPLFILALLAAVITPLMFGLMNGALSGPNVQTRMAAMYCTGIIGVFFILMIILLAVYLYVKPGRPLWHYLLTAVLVTVILSTPVSMPYFFVFRTILPGQIDPAQNYPFAIMFIKMLFAAGFMEELLKATPILIGLWLSLRAAKSASAGENRAFNLLRVRGPLDGALMGVFAGGGFIFVETAFDYIPRLSSQVLQQTNDPMAAIAMGLLLLLPRVFGGLVGHMAYSGLFGYFIGLSVIRPKQMWKLLAIGYVSSSTIHALWNSVDAISPLLNYAVAGASAVALVGALLKARQLEAFGTNAGALETSGSIVVDRTAQPAQRIPSPVQLTPLPVAPAMPGQALVLDIDGIVIPLREASQLNLGAEPALAGRGAGVLGEVVAHPTRPGVLGLRNTGGGAWTARLRDGGVQTIEPSQNVRLAPGVIIAFSVDINGNIRTVGQERT
jgi:RsiW-degrading membrane proteinase PrsW (M82 family)